MGLCKIVGNEDLEMKVAPIKTRQDYLRMLKEIENLMAAERNTPEGDCLDMLVVLVESWEARHCLL